LFKDAIQSDFVWEREPLTPRMLSVLFVIALAGSAAAAPSAVQLSYRVDGGPYKPFASAARRGERGAWVLEDVANVSLSGGAGLFQLKAGDALATLPTVRRRRAGVRHAALGPHRGPLVFA
jgi:hypothetical protein